MSSTAIDVLAGYVFKVKDILVMDRNLPKGHPECLRPDRLLDLENWLEDLVLIVRKTRLERCAEAREPKHVFLAVKAPKHLYGIVGRNLKLDGYNIVSSASCFSPLGAWLFVVKVPVHDELTEDDVLNLVRPAYPHCQVWVTFPKQ